MNLIIVCMATVIALVVLFSLGAKKASLDLGSVDLSEMEVKEQKQVKRTWVDCLEHFDRMTLSQLWSQVQDQYRSKKEFKKEFHAKRKNMGVKGVDHKGGMLWRTAN